MRRALWTSMPLLACTAVALGQEPQDPEPARYEGDPYAQIERVQVSFGDPAVVEETLTMKSDEHAATTAERVEPLMERFIEQSGRAEMLAAMGATDVPTKSEVVVTKNVVKRTAWIPAAKYPFVAMSRKWVLQQARNR